MSDKEPDDDKPSLGHDLERLERLLRHGVTLGVVIGIICHLLPPQYKYVCNQIMHLCTLGVN